MKKKLVIIHGVTGAIGSACLSLFASQPNTVVYGISRQAKHFDELSKDLELPPKTLACSVFSDEQYRVADVSLFLHAIPKDTFSEIHYIHAIGHYPFEVDEQGNHFISHDNNLDGIDDRCMLLTEDVFMSFYTNQRTVDQKIRFFIFGGIADQHRPKAHASWWKTMEFLKEELQDSRFQNEILKSRVSLVNVSSVLCPSELIERPFVFNATDADPRYWLRPEEVAVYLSSLMKKRQTQQFKEYKFFKKKPGFDPEYYTDEKFTPRKVAEIYSSQLNTTK